MQSSLTIGHLQAAGKGDVQGGRRPSESLGLIKLQIVSDFILANVIWC